MLNYKRKKERAAAREGVIKAAIEEAIIKIIGKTLMDQPDIDQIALRNILEEVLYDYSVQPTEKALVVQNDVREKTLMYLACMQLKGLSTRTLEGYNLHLRRFAAYMQKNLQDIDSMDIRMYLATYAKTGVQNSTIAKEISVLRCFFTWLENNDYINKSPMRKVDSIKFEKRLRKALSAEELEILMDSCKTLRERAMVEFFFSTGCRLDEVQKTNKNDLNWQNSSVNVIGKGNKERPVYITDKARVHIRKYLLSRKDDCEALFVTMRKPYRRLGRRSIEREVSKIAKRAGLEKKVFPHLLRHTTAKTLLNRGANLYEVQRILGHEHPATTQIYAQMEDESVKSAHKKYLA